MHWVSASQCEGRIAEGIRHLDRQSHRIADIPDAHPMSTSLLIMKSDPRAIQDLIAAVFAETDEHRQWELIHVLQFRGTQDVLDAAKTLSTSLIVRERILGADILGQLGVPQRAFPDESVNQPRK